MEDIGTNTMAEDNYKKYGLLDKKTANPLVKMFVYLMSNDSFRRDFEDKLLSLSENELEKDRWNVGRNGSVRSCSDRLRQFCRRCNGCD